MDAREEFLRTWYTILWSNIDRSMRSIWEIVGPIGLVGGAFIVESKLGPNLTAAIQLIIIFWALNNTMDMNAWHRRNLLFAARVEREFLLDKDYGTVIPASFRNPRTDWIEFYSINFWTFSGLLVAVVVDYLVLVSRSHPPSFCFLLGPTAVLLAGGAFTVYTYKRCEKQIDRYLKGISCPVQTTNVESNEK